MDERGAIFDSSGKYRYRLWRRWSGGDSACFIMLNPSTADATRDDATIRRCRWFAREAGYGGLEVVNLYAYCATHPRLLWEVADPVGPENARHVAEAVAAAGIVVAAWGRLGAKATPVFDIPLMCLGVNSDGSPKHPGRIARKSALQAYLPKS